MMITEETRRLREHLVLDHFHDEVLHHWDDVLSTFPHPRYEIIPLMAVHEGKADVEAYYHDTRAAFPDQRHEIIAFRHADDAVVTEFWLLGTHTGPLGAIPPTGGKFRIRVTAFFIFDASETLICERIYFDTLSLLKQLLSHINFRNPVRWPILFKVLRGLGANASAPDPSLVNTPQASFPGYTHPGIAQ